MPDEELVLAGPLSRAASAAVDAALLATVAFFIIITTAKTGLPPFGWATLFVFTLYYGYMLGEHGKSVGNSLTGTMVTGGDGSRLGYLGAALRTTVFMTPLAALIVVNRLTDREIYTMPAAALFLLYAALNVAGAVLPYRRTLYDALTGTYVLQACGNDPAALRKATTNNVVVLVMACFCIGILLLGLLVFGLLTTKQHWC